MKYIEKPKKQIFKIENKPWLRNIYESIDAPCLTRFDKVIEANKSIMSIVQNKARELAQRTLLTYPEAVGIFMDYTKQNKNSMENISVEEVLEYYNKKDEK